MAKINLKKASIVILALALSICALTLGVFADDGHDHAAEAAEGLSKNAIVGLVIAGIIVIAVIVTVIILAASAAKREKFFKFFRGYKSELRKIVWCPADQLRKSSIVVIVGIVVCAVVLALLDMGFSRGIMGLNSLFS